jgi:hypothetical protein
VSFFDIAEKTNIKDAFIFESPMRASGGEGRVEIFDLRLPACFLLRV